MCKTIRKTISTSIHLEPVESEPICEECAIDRIATYLALKWEKEGKVLPRRFQGTLWHYADCIAREIVKEVDLVSIDLPRNPCQGG